MGAYFTKYIVEYRRISSISSTYRRIIVEYRRIIVEYRRISSNIVEYRRISSDIGEWGDGRTDGRTDKKQYQIVKKAPMMDHLTNM